MMEIWIYITLTFVSLSNCENLTLLSQSRTGYLENYVGYASTALMHFDIPQDVEFASFQFRAGIMSNSIFHCNAKDVVIYMKVDAPPVINPDKSKFPANYLWNGRPELYHIEFLSNETYKYVNVTYPKAGSYYAVAFHPYVNPKDQGITQEGLLPECNTYVDASVYITKDENIIPLIPYRETKMILKPGDRQLFKIFMPENVTHILVNFKEIIFCDNCTMLTTNFYSPRKFEQNFDIFKSDNRKHVTTKFRVMENMYHHMNFSVDTKDKSVEIMAKFIFEIRYIYFIDPFPNFTPYRNGSSKHVYLNALQKAYFDRTYTLSMPYKQYNLHKSLSAESFLFTYEMQPLNDGSVPIAINLTSEEFSVLKFNVRDSLDVGGSIEVILAFKPRVKKNGKYFDIAKEPASHTIVGCIHNSAIELPAWENQCKYLTDIGPAPIIINSTNDNTSLIIPYPESGDWYFSFKLFCGDCEPCRCPSRCRDEFANCTDLCEQTCEGYQCYNCTRQCEKIMIGNGQCKECDCDGSCKRRKEQCNSSVLFDINSYPCIRKGCGSNGKCMFMVSQAFIYSSCGCSNNYRGWDCSDDSEANSMGSIILELLLLVLSNLMFLPAVYIAYKRKYYVEMTVYFFTCLSSSLYHGCDAGEHIISYCIVRLSVLQYCDFYCALLSIWVSLIALAHLTKPLTPILHICGAILIGAGTTLDKTSIGVFLVPVTIGIIIMTASWIYKYYKTKQIFPSKRYLKITLPCGLIIVVIALLMYSVLQTQSNYKYVHSLWHMLMATAIMILLPNLKTFLPNESYSI